MLILLILGTAVVAFCVGYYSGYTSGHRDGWIVGSSETLGRVNSVIDDLGLSQ